MKMIPKPQKIKDPAKYADFDLPREKLEYALKEALKKIDIGLASFTPESYPASTSKNYVYERHGNTGWGSGFWPGMVWLAYELTGEEKYKEHALSFIDSMHTRIVEKIAVNHHDMGFIYTPSCVAAYKLCGNEKAKEAALMAADHLMTRYSEKGKFIQAWGDVGDPASYRLIIDCLLNIPLLYWATEQTGDPKYAEAAYNHFQTAVEVCCRADGSTYQTYYFDVNTHEPLRGVTKQGLSDDSAWSRGQAWGIYGPMLTYKYKHDQKSIDTFKATTAYFLNQLPEDYVAYWDLWFTEGDVEPRDSSAASCAICGMLEAYKYMDDSDPYKQIFYNAAKRIMNSLIDNYLTKDIPESDGLLKCATYYKAGNLGIHELNTWGDYFYMEALMRFLNPDWELYW
ncbi:MAG: glycoside hydrolase family 88 protein [Clostridia bacterium]|nr:glycoside hydrolase family 88 protein [Clostridia bacterium]